jgi:hypothetical protein
MHAKGDVVPYARQATQTDGVDLPLRQGLTGFSTISFKSLPGTEQSGLFFVWLKALRSLHLHRTIFLVAPHV